MIFKYERKKMKNKTNKLLIVLVVFSIGLNIYLGFEMKKILRDINIYDMEHYPKTDLESTE